MSALDYTPKEYPETPAHQLLYELLADDDPELSVGHFVSALRLALGLTIEDIHASASARRKVK
jgi:hypothetical protein